MDIVSYRRRFEIAIFDIFSWCRLDEICKVVKNEGENMVQYSQQMNCREMSGLVSEKTF